MPHNILAGPHPNLIVIRISGDLTVDDLDLGAKLGLGSGIPAYLLVDASDMLPVVPENFLDSARHSPFSHPDVKHTAVFLRTGLIAMLAKVVPKLTRQQDKVSIFNSYDEALSHLLKLIQQGGL